jgi:hypothetical protein
MLERKGQLLLLLLLATPSIGRVGSIPPGFLTSPGWKYVRMIAQEKQVCGVACAAGINAGPKEVLLVWQHG